jgi:hypothetical protein
MYITQVIFPLMVVTIALYLMVVAGMGKSVLELRRPPRICPSCGRATNGGCRCSRPS